MTNDVMIEKAKELGARALNQAQYNLGTIANPVEPEDVYVVWFCKTLQNWKALVSTNKISSAHPAGDYVEITHNGDGHVTYCDVYRKKLNVAYEDEKEAEA